MFTNIPPVESYSMDFFIHLIPFLFFNQLALMVATWGINSNRGGQFFIAISPIVLRAFWDVIRRKPIRFVVTSKIAKAGNYLSMVKVQMAVIALYAVAILYSLSLYIIGERIYLTGYVVNLMWSLFNVLSLWAIVKAALYKFEG
jgi:cellulose synthase (UDP-forming)